jgi:hypothetical protein
MRAILLLLTAMMLVGCITLPEFDGTSRDVPAVDEYRFTVKFSDKDKIQQKCRSRSFVGGKLVIEDNARTVDACITTARHDSHYDSQLYIEKPSGKEDAYWWETFIHEVAHPLFDWRH